MTNKINQFFLFNTDEINSHQYIDGKPYFLSEKYWSILNLMKTEKI